ncbi:MAG TPA: hypothetical protein VFS43_17000 [Polyangiaceae bacterium]|nr:hypothetical protein [Polyangiaceae bacterium]
MRRPLALAALALALAAARPAPAQVPPPGSRPIPPTAPGPGPNPPAPPGARGEPARPGGTGDPARSQNDRSGSPLSNDAQPSTPQPSAPEGGPREKPAPVPEGREPIDYDGRPDPGASPGEVALWVPRVVLFPLYLVSEFVVRRPIGALAVAAERGKWVPAVVDFFTFGPEKKAAFVPTGLLDFGLRPSVGLYFFADDAFVKKNDLRLYGATGGLEFLHFTVTDRVRLGEKGGSTLAVRGDFLRRSDFVYHGLGPRSLHEDRTRYAVERVEGGLSYDVRVSGNARYRAYVGLREVDFRRGCCFGRRLKPLVESGAVAPPPGYPEGYTNLFQRAELVFDSRPENEPFFDGVRLALEGEHGSDLRREGDGPSRWVRYGGTLGGFVDVTGKDRVLSLSVTALLADRLSGAPIPFTEQIVLGGDLMPAYLPGRLVGRSAFIGTLQYTWPVWAAIQGYTQVAVGNVFGRHFEDARPDLLRGNVGLGLRSTSSRDHALEVLFAAGTETFADGFRVNSFRLRIGGTSGF